LTGEQGVLIPAANIKHLMLRRDVVAAAEAGQFKIYAIENIDQAIAILTGMSAGEADSNGAYPEGSVNRRVAARLTELTEIRQSFARRVGKKTVAKKKMD
jgi:predicted ATP-dependent protease